MSAGRFSWKRTILHPTTIIFMQCLGFPGDHESHGIHSSERRVVITLALAGNLDASVGPCLASLKYLGSLAVSDAHHDLKLSARQNCESSCLMRSTTSSEQEVFGRGGCWSAVGGTAMMILIVAP